MKLNVFLLILSLSSISEAQTTITSSDKLQWTQAASSLAIAQAFTYFVYVDTNTKHVLVSVICSGVMSPFTCNAPFPMMSAGIHSLEITASDIAESLKSISFIVQVVAPSIPGNVNIVTIEGARSKCGINIMPIGIPCPSFGLEEQSGSGLPSRPSPWLSEVKNAYYIDNSVSCTNISNPYGSPNNPRCEIPFTAGAIIWEYESGSYIEVHGGPYSPAPGSSFVIDFEFCMVSNPCYMVGVGTAGEKSVAIAGDFNGDGLLDSFPIGCNRVYLNVIGCVEIRDRRFQHTGSYYVIEGFYQAGISTSNTQILPLSGKTPDHYGIRWSEIESPLKIAGACVSVVNSSYGVFHRLNIHDCGDHILAATMQNDVHGIHGGSDGADHNWFIENKIWHNGGDGIQINATQMFTTAPNFLYFGRNEVFENGENAIDLKTCEDFIASENNMWGYVDAAASDGAIVVLNDENHVPGFYENNNRLWIIFNYIHDSTGPGVRSQTNGYIFGNIIYNVANCLVVFTNRSGTEFENNTCDELNNTVTVTSATDFLTGNIAGTVDKYIIAKNNIFSNNLGNSPHIRIDGETSAHSMTSIKNNLFPLSGVTYQWDSVQQTTLANWQIASIGKAINNNIGTPNYTNSSLRDYRLTINSIAAINQGIVPTIPGLFQSIYGQNISYDWKGISRPQNNVWDLGANELWHYLLIQYLK